MQPDLSRVPLPGLTRTTTSMSSTKKGKNPFPQVGDWTEESFQDVEVEIGTIVPTTNAYTRSINPKANYWKGPITFKCNNFESSIIKQFNVPVPYIKGSNYGDNYAYVCLPIFIANKIVNAANKKGLRVEPAEDKMASTQTEWWKTLNKMTDAVGIVTSDGQFVPKSLGTVFEATKKGVRVNLDYTISIRLMKEDSDTLTDKDVYRLVVDCSRASIKEIKVDVEAPQLTAKVPTQKASKEDVATQDLIEQLALLGVN